MISYKVTDILAWLDLCNFEEIVAKFLEVLEEIV